MKYLPLIIIVGYDWGCNVVVIFVVLPLDDFISSIVCETLPFIIRQVPIDVASLLERAAIRLGPTDVGEMPSILPDL